MKVHRETLEEEATHVTDEARMVLPGVQAVLGFQLVAVFNQRFQEFVQRPSNACTSSAFLLVALAMGLMMTPAAYHRQVERGRVSRRFINLSSNLLTFAHAASDRGRHPRHLPDRAADPRRARDGYGDCRRRGRNADWPVVRPARVRPPSEKLNARQRRLLQSPDDEDPPDASWPCRRNPARAVSRPRRARADRPWRGPGRRACQAHRRRMEARGRLYQPLAALRGDRRQDRRGLRRQGRARTTG